MLITSALRLLRFEFVKRSNALTGNTCPIHWKCSSYWIEEYVCTKWWSFCLINRMIKTCHSPIWGMTLTYLHLLHLLLGYYLDIIVSILRIGITMMIRRKTTSFCIWKIEHHHFHEYISYQILGWALVIHEDMLKTWQGEGLYWVAQVVPSPTSCLCLQNLLF